ncbi:unnamed protein product [Oncorhynchus mykiss]|uniref:Probable U3 small nucleolar RNA-associated protein 11 n=1 Tax=Oncorhynchus mykiss TaxID=8022 RepID=A0A060XQN9_ONCMY|nr:unnamed protein product [Oncorhynchus mykiss]
MSSFRKALKSQQKNHKKDPSLVFENIWDILKRRRITNFVQMTTTRNRTPLLLCVKKALDKNPDEFYFKMVSSQLKDGVHVLNKAKGTEEENKEEQRKLMRTQDIRYVEMKSV